MKGIVTLIGIALVVVIGLGVVAVFNDLTAEPITTGIQARQIEPKNTILSMEQAKKIAEASDCMDEGMLTGDYFYNENSKTWWFEMDILKHGCAPACVVSETTGNAEINWRCTGALP